MGSLFVIPVCSLFVIRGLLVLVKPLTSELIAGCYSHWYSIVCGLSQGLNSHAAYFVTLSTGSLCA
jgi:uncharacterized membrane protein